ncbi:hypothetical protein CLU79DRAFT_836287 [Phycomyces nitens]|nr:hypothetical protein CLU79DRAFT_836287 [Phycomyces nitens]
MGIYQEENCCYRLYIGNGNWINLGQDTTRELLAIYEKGVATRFELIPGLAIDILPNDVDCNSKNTDLPMLMRADLVSVDPDSTSSPGKKFSSYIKDLLEKQGIVDVFPPVRLGEDLPLVTSLPSHRHLSMVPAPIGMSRRSNRSSASKDGLAKYIRRSPAVLSSASSTNHLNSSSQQASNHFNGVQPTVPGNKKKRGKKGPVSKKTVVPSLSSGIMTRSQQRQSRLMEDIETDQNYTPNNSAGAWVDSIASSSSLSSYPLSQANQQVFLHHRVPSNMYRKDPPVDTSSSAAFYTPHNVFKQPSQPLFQQRAMSNYPATAMQNINYQHTPDAVQPYHSQALPGLSMFTSSLASMDCEDDSSGESALQRSSIHLYSTLSHSATMTPIPANWMERDMWNMATQPNVIDTSEYGSVQTHSYSPYPLHTPEISYNSNNISNENDSPSQTGMVVSFQLGVPSYAIEANGSPSSISTLGSIPLSSFYNDPPFYKSNESTDCCQSTYQESQSKRDSILEHRSMSPKDIHVLAPLTNLVVTSRYASPHQSVISS